MESKTIGVLTFPIKKNGIIPLSNLLDIFSNLSSKIHLITGNEGFDYFKTDQRLKVFNVTHTNSRNIIKRVVRYLTIQLQMVKLIIKLRRNVSIWIFFIGGSSLILPILTSKILGKRTYLFLAGSEKKGADNSYGFLSRPIKLLINAGYSIVDGIIIYSTSLIVEWNLESYKNKIFIAHEHFLDFKKFNVSTPLINRPPLIGYIGSLGEIKGIQNFVQALPSILSNQPDLRILIIGDGRLLHSITKSLSCFGINGRVDIIGWVPHEDLPKYLNQLRLLVIPSYSEGLPNIMLEAMACGTPVLATPVGAIPSIIVDNETGFIMGDNSPDCIAKNVAIALSNARIGQIAENGRHFVERYFVFENGVAIWKEILERM